MNKIYQVDSFTNEPFRGNPAAVCLLSSMPDDEWLASVAAEMNLSETAFVVPNDDHFLLRWFTPTVEVELCGHATLAAAKILFERQLLNGKPQVAFETASGRLTAQCLDDSIVLDFPAAPAISCEPPHNMSSILNSNFSFCGQNQFDYLVQMESEQAVLCCQPDLAAMKEFGVRGVMVTAASEKSEYDFVSRYFAPGAGIDEDPVTGSAHCALAPHWASRLKRSKMTGYQASQRGGFVGVEIVGDRVHLSGHAVIVMEGDLFW